MRTMDQITYRAPTGGTGMIAQVAASTGEAEAGRWRQLLEPFLLVGRPLGRGYLDLGSRAAFVRWYAEAGSPPDWQYALALVGDRGVLTASYALELPDLDRQALYSGSGPVPVARTGHGPGRDVIAALARSADARHLLVPLLARVLLDEHRITMPWTEPSLPEAAMWGLMSILEIVGDKQPVSFLTYASDSNWNADFPGTFVSFRPGAALVPPDSGFTRLATALVERFADSPDELREAVSRQGCWPRLTVRGVSRGCSPCCPEAARGHSQGPRASNRKPQAIREPQTTGGPTGRPPRRAPRCRRRLRGSE